MKILFVTNLPSPYRVDFFNELGKLSDLTVFYERSSASDRDQKWKGNVAATYTERYIKLKPLGTDRSIGLGLVKAIKKQKFDVLILSGYASPSVMFAIAYCKRKKIPYYIESDGGFCKKDRFPKSLLKKFLLSKAKGHFVTCEEYKNYLLTLGVDESRIHKYPFTSLKSEDILLKTVSAEEKKRLREKLKINEEKVILTVGRFIKIKGFDILLKSVRNISKDIGVYLVGGVPTEEYLLLQKDLRLKNIHFVDFKSKNELKEYYKASDLFVLPTRGDVWGLVINEAMACGLPIVTTNKCIAGLELVKNGENGYLVEKDDPDGLADRIKDIIENEEVCSKMGERSLAVIGDYTVENMAKKHISFFE